MKKQLIIALALIIAMFSCSGKEGTDDNPPYVDPNLPKLYWYGSHTDITPTPLPGFVLAGGGTDNNVAMQWMLQRANGGDVVVLRSNDSNGYNSYFFAELGIRVNSVVTVVITSKTEANSDSLAKIIRRAELLFIAGGDQWNYIDYWSGTKTADAINYLINTKKVTVGGTSAGMAVMGQVVFDAKNGTPTSAEALANPYSSKVTLTKDFLSVPTVLQSLVTDSHYSNRDRHGRHLAFMARMVKDWSMTAKGIACDENTAVCIDGDNRATVYGPCAYFIKQNGAAPETCTNGQPLTWNAGGQALRVYKLPGNNSGSSTFNLNDWSTAAGGVWQWWSVSNGTLSEINQ